MRSSPITRIRKAQTVSLVRAELARSNCPIGSSSPRWKLGDGANQGQVNRT